MEHEWGHLDAMGVTMDASGTWVGPGGESLHRQRSPCSCDAIIIGSIIGHPPPAGEGRDHPVREHPLVKPQGLQEEHPALGERLEKV